MESGVVAVGAAAIAYYVYSRTPGDLSGNRVETHRHIEQAPSSWTGELYLFAEALRYLYLEYITHWQTADLFIGLFYLTRQGIRDFPVAEVVAHGTRLHPKSLDKPYALQLKSKFEIMHRLLVYSQKLRNTSVEIPTEEWIDLGICAEDFVLYRPKASVLCPAYIIVKDPVLHCFVLAIRGTHTTRDIFTSLSGAAKPHHYVDCNGLVLGYSHLGMLAGARWIFKHCKTLLLSAHEKQPNYGVVITGHSMGGGAAAMLTMMIREQLPQLGDVQCYTFACPGCMTLELASSCAPYVTTLIYGADVVPTISPGAGDILREEVAQSSWRNSFRQDIRSSTIVQSLEGIRGMYRSASTWTMRQARTVSSLTTACIRPREQGQSAATATQSSPDLTNEEASQVPETSKSDAIEETSKAAREEDVIDQVAAMSIVKEIQKEAESGGDLKAEEPADNVPVVTPLLDKTTRANISNRSGYMSELWSRMSTFSWRRRVTDAAVANDDPVTEETEGEVEGVFNAQGLEETRGGESSSEGSSSNSSNLKRLLYPAGMIYHLVPDFMLKYDTNNHESSQDTQDTQASPSEATSEIDRSQDQNTSEEETGFVLFTDMPQEAYGRIRVCRSMVQDHFVPRYKTALKSVIDDLANALEEDTTQHI